MIANLINYVQALRTARPGPWAGPAGVVLVSVGLFVLGRAAGQVREDLEEDQARLRDLDTQFRSTGMALKGARTEYDRLRPELARLQADIKAAEDNARLSQVSPTMYPTKEDLTPLATGDPE